MTTTLQQLTASQANKEVAINRNFETLSPAGMYGKKQSTTTGLTLGYYGGHIASSVIGDGTVSLTNAATNYVVAHRTTGAVTAATNTTNWDATGTYGRLFKATTAGSVITALEFWHQQSGGWFDRTGVSGLVTSVNGATGAVVLAAADLGYTPTTAADWDGAADPGNTDDALDQLAERVADLEASPGGSTQGRHAVYIAAGSMAPSVTGGCATLARIASAANQPDIVSIDFDATTQEYAQFALTMPKSWNEGTVTFAPVWSHAATTTDFGVVFDLQGYAASNDDAIATAFGTAQTSADTGGTTNDIYMGPESSAVTIAGTPAAEDTVFFRLSRVTGNGSDTMAIDARLHGVVLYITTNADTDA
jgi:hypothetical protein